MTMWKSFEIQIKTLLGPLTLVMSRHSKNVERMQMETVIGQA